MYTEKNDSDRRVESMDNKSTITLDKEELDKVFYDFGLVENEIANFLLIINALQEHLEDDMLNDKYAILSLVKNQLTIFHKELYDTLGNADELLFEM